MQWTDGMLYPVLHRLERQGMIEADWRLSESGRKRKYYRLKKEGLKAIQLQQEQWMLVHTTLCKLWEGNPCLS